MSCAAAAADAMLSIPHTMTTGACLAIVLATT
jgi:hypothetical protein